MSDNAAKIKQLKNTFGQQLDQEVLESVLEICNGNVKDATEFLRAQGNDYIEKPGQVGPVLPADYKTKPNGWLESKITSKKDPPHAITDLKAFLLSESTFLQHFEKQNSDYSKYAAALLIMLHYNIELTSACKTKILAASWARHDWRLADLLLNRPDCIQLPEILRALKILDGPRRVRQLEKKLATLKASGKVKQRTLGKVRSKINDAKSEVSEGQKTSVSGALSKRVVAWVKNIPSSKLEFYAMQMPKEPWMELSDIVHFNPNDFQLSWFLNHCFGKAPPADAMMTHCINIAPDTADQLLAQYNVPYSFLRKQVPDLSDACRAKVAGYEPLDQVIWYYEELACAEVNDVIDSRLTAGEKPSFSYGKLMERLMYFKQNGAAFYEKLLPVAEERLHEMTIPLDPPVVVLGDASYSMDVAIRTATIIGSLLAALTSADLKFFNTELVSPKVVPKTVTEVLEVATNTKADGQTAPACAIHQYYKEKTIVKCFIMVTDEIENLKAHGHYFAQYFYKYYTEVYPAKLVFVSFSDNPKEKGRMVQALESMGIVPLQFRLDGRRPDLTKLDTLIGILSCEQKAFINQVENLSKKVVDNDISLALEYLKSSKSITSTSVSSSTPTKSALVDDAMKLVEAAKKVKLSTTDRVVAEGVSSELRDRVVEAENTECAVCMESKADTAVLECGHMAYCFGCASKLKECSICRASVTRCVRIFKAI